MEVEVHVLVYGLKFVGNGVVQQRDALGAIHGSLLGVLKTFTLSGSRSTRGRGALAPRLFYLQEAGKIARASIEVSS
jgi:hypothetical protein